MAANQHDTADEVQDRLSEFAFRLDYAGLSPQAIRAAKIRIVDTLGALLGGWNGLPCGLARKLAGKAATADGASVIGTRITTTPDMAAFANATAARFVEMNDAYHIGGRRGGHPSDIIMPAWAAAQYQGIDGREFITAVVAGYEAYLRTIDAIEIPGFDYTNFVCLGSAVAAAKAMRLGQKQIAHAIALAVIPNNTLRQGAIGQLSMWKVLASGQAGRAGVFAALLAREGVEGPNQPFQGKEGWCNYISRKRFALESMGGAGVPFKVEDSIIKLRPVRYATIPAVLAAEQLGPLADSKNIREVVVESFKRAVEGLGEHHWHPHSRESATHSMPYTVAAALLDGKVTPRTFDDDKINDANIRALMNKVRVQEDQTFTRAHRNSSRHYARVSVVTMNDERSVGVTGGEHGDLSDKPDETMISRKFRDLAATMLASSAIDELLEQLWKLEEVADVGRLASELILGTGRQA
jgi:2-methylcitrate dehydratase